MMPDWRDTWRRFMTAVIITFLLGCLLVGTYGLFESFNR